MILLFLLEVSPAAVPGRIVRKPELTCLLSENARRVGRPRDALGLYATLDRAPDILGLLWIHSISLCRVAVTPTHISWVLRVLIFSRQKALCLVTVVFSDSYSISKNLHVLLCSQVFLHFMHFIYGLIKKLWK